MPLPPTIRPELPSDIETIHHLTEEAFSRTSYTSGTEQHIIDALRQAGALTLSLVAEVDGQVVGHIAFSPVTVSGGSTGWYGLGPVAVKPEFQGQGIGSALVQSGLAALREQGARGCVLVGDPAFYGRFGFSNDPALTFEGVPQEYFLALPFGEQPARGDVKYHPAFNASG
jgi:putative acetyltransferase